MVRVFCRGRVWSSGRRFGRSAPSVLALLSLLPQANCNLSFGGMSDWGGPRAHLRLESAVVTSVADESAALQRGPSPESKDPEALTVTPEGGGEASVFVREGRHRVRVTLRECAWEDWVTTVVLEIEETGEPASQAKLDPRGLGLIITQKLKARQPSFDIGPKDKRLEPLAMEIRGHGMASFIPNEAAVRASEDPHQARGELVIMEAVELDWRTEGLTPLSGEFQLQDSEPLPLVSHRPVRVSAHFFCNHAAEALLKIPVLMPEEGVRKEVALKLVHDPKQAHLF